jgi:hypothetical protein
MTSWPTFELVTFNRDRANELLPPPLSERLASVGVPRDFFGGRYRVEQDLHALESPSGRLVCFGAEGLHGQICVDVQTGTVVEVMSPEDVPRFVNTSLDHFSRTVQAVINRFPFHSVDADREEIDLACEDVAQIIRGIDPDAMRPDQFWSTLIDDIGMRDFDLEVMGLAGEVRH